MQRLTPLALLAMLILTTVSLGQNESSSKNDPAQQKLDALLAEFQAAEHDPIEAYQTFKPRFEALAKEYSGTEPEARATLWLIQQTWWLRSDGKMESTSMPMAEDLIKSHPDSPQLGLLAEYYYVFSKEQRQTLFNRLLDISKHPAVLAAAHFGLAKMSSPRGADGSPNEHFAALMGKYAKVKWRESTYGAIADAYLNPLSPADLAIGKPAPEITGIDHNGKPMKLSDYRGKVVLLDFWGDW